MTRKLSILALLIALAVALPVVGCGDDDDDDAGGDGGTTTSAGGGEPLSKQEFISQADRICAQGDAEIDRGGQEFAGTSGEEVDELVLTVIAPGYRDQIEQIRELTPPEGDEAEIDEFLNTFEDGIEQLEADPSQLANGEALKTIVEARSLAFEYGFKSCARSG